MSADEDKRRLKMVLINPEQLLWSKQKSRMPTHDSWVRVPVLDIPDGCDVVGVNYEPRYQAFVVTIRHPSFDVVPLGEWVPILEAELLTMPVASLVEAEYEHAV